MENHKKILILFMFLFIYFVMPRDVLADEPTKHDLAQTCVCTRKGRNTSSKFCKLDISKDGSGTDSGSKSSMIYTIVWDNNPPSGWASGTDIEVGNSGLQYYNPISGTNSSSVICPAYMVIENRTFKRFKTKTSTEEVRNYGYMYFYDQTYSGNANSKLSSINNPSVNKKEDLVRNYNNKIVKADDDSDDITVDYGEGVLVTCEAQYSHPNGESNTDGFIEDHNQDDARVQVDHDTQKEIDEYNKLKEQLKKKSDPAINQKHQTCEDVFGVANDETGQSVAWLLQRLFNYIRIFGVLLVIVLSAFDYTKSIISSDFDSLKKAQKRHVFRMIAVVALLLLPMLINFLLGLFISRSLTDFTCGIK